MTHRHNRLSAGAALDPQGAGHLCVDYEVDTKRQFCCRDSAVLWTAPAALGESTWFLVLTATLIPVIPAEDEHRRH